MKNSNSKRIDWTTEKLNQYVKKQLDGKRNKNISRQEVLNLFDEEKEYYMQFSKLEIAYNNIVPVTVNIKTNTWNE